MDDFLAEALAVDWCGAVCGNAGGQQLVVALPQQSAGLLRLLAALKGALNDRSGNPRGRSETAVA